MDGRHFPTATSCKKRHKRLQQDGDDNPPLLLTDLPNDKAGRVALSTIKPDLSAFELLTLARKLVDGHHDYQAKELGIAVFGFFREKVRAGSGGPAGSDPCGLCGHA